jgi:CO dehydrogenase maturation factor
MKKRKPVIIAVCGKGGSGKTCISALLVRILSEADTSRKVLAIDADPAVGLASVLGMKVKKTVDDIRNVIIAELGDKAEGNRRELLKRLDYEVFESLTEKGNIALLAIGRPEREGCFCKVNSFLKDVIKETAGSFDFVVIDGEAGIEQVNRRVMETVTHLLLVTDTSARGRQVVETIAEVSKRSVSYDKIGVLINKVRNENEYKSLIKSIKSPIIGWLPDDESIRASDMAGKPVFALPPSPAFKALEKAIKAFLK